jgi:hypothetical protein
MPLSSRMGHLTVTTLALLEVSLKPLMWMLVFRGGLTKSLRLLVILTMAPPVGGTCKVL